MSKAPDASRFKEFSPTVLHNQVAILRKEWLRRPATRLSEFPKPFILHHSLKNVPFRGCKFTQDFDVTGQFWGLLRRSLDSWHRQALICKMLDSGWQVWESFHRATTWDWPIDQSVWPVLNDAKEFCCGDLFDVFQIFDTVLRGNCRCGHFSKSCCRQWSSARLPRIV